MINIAICDDDKVILSEIKNLLLNIAEKNFIKIDVNTYYDGSSLEKDINKGEVFDLLYLDIEMSQNGILTAKRLRERGYDVLIIYISSYEKYFRELFEVNRSCKTCWQHSLYGMEKERTLVGAVSSLFCFLVTELTINDKRGMVNRTDKNVP